ncbi:MAG: hypothetical protein PUD97_01975 [Paludibacteraceae bacterium]|nr:hypothetical protein [Paludibacteraceae bacterium]
MENQPQGLKESVALQSYITRKSTFFGLINRLVYAPTDSRLNFTCRYYAPILREELKELFALGGQVLEKRLAKMNRFEQAVNGNLLVECCVSADKEFAALQLKHFEQIDYQPISDVRFLQGESAMQAAKIFDL